MWRDTQRAEGRCRGKRNADQPHPQKRRRRRDPRDRIGGGKARRNRLRKRRKRTRSQKTRSAEEGKVIGGTSKSTPKLNSPEGSTLAQKKGTRRNTGGSLDKLHLKKCYQSERRIRRPKRNARVTRGGRAPCRASR